MADTKTTALTALTALTGDETIYIVEDDDGTPVSRRITIEDLLTAIAARTELTTVFKALAGDYLWIPAGAMVISASTPTLSFVASAGSRLPAWLLDASTAEAVSHSLIVPTSWATMHVDFYWTNAGAGSGNVRWQAQRDSFADGDSLTGSSTALVTATAPSQDVLEVTRMLTSEACTPGELFNVRAIRDATNAADTLANDCGLLGVLLTRAS